MAAEMSGKDKPPSDGDGARERREEFLRKRLPQGGTPPGPSEQGEEQPEEKPEEKRRDAPERKSD
jgi:hypothetical protein